MNVLKYCVIHLVSERESKQTEDATSDQAESPDKEVRVPEFDDRDIQPQNSPCPESLPESPVFVYPECLDLSEHSKATSAGTCGLSLSLSQYIIDKFLTVLIVTVHLFQQSWKEKGWSLKWQFRLLWKRSFC